MINIVLIAPYEQSRHFIQSVVDHYNAQQSINVTVHVFDNDEISSLSITGDVIIARGYNMELIREQTTNIPLVPLDVSGYDIIKAVIDAQQIYNAQRIAIIGPREMVDSVENIQDILAISLDRYYADIEELDEVLDRARADGCDCFIGGYAVYERCRPDDHRILVKIGKSTIVTSIDEAVRTVNLLRQQHKTSARFKTLIDYSRDGIISIDEQGIITSINHSAQEYLYLGIGVIGKQAKSVLPFARKMINDVWKTGRKIENEIYKVNDCIYAVDCVPLNLGTQTDGVTLFIRSVDRIQQDESLLRKKIVAKRQSARYNFEDIIYSSDLISRTIEEAKLYAEVDSPVLIFGESGVGKELIAQSIHNYSRRKGGPFIGINCAALSESLLESELFGYSDGAFTGALKGGREGLFEAAHGGTLFLDEISEIPHAFQSKLLRVLQENEVRRVGSQQVISVDVRILAATNKNLSEMVKSGQFRQDLFFRLNVLPLYIPPLRDRPEDILGLFDNYLREYNMRYHRNISVITGEAKKAITAYPWYGNTRELKNVAERVCVLAQGSAVNEADIRRALYVNQRNFEIQAETSNEGEEQPGHKELDELERIQLLLKQFGGNKTKVAQHLGIDRSTLWRKLRKLKT